MIPGQGAGSHVLQLKVLQASTKILVATTKTQRSQINKLIKIAKTKKTEQRNNTKLGVKVPAPSLAPFQSLEQVPWSHL